MKKFFLLAVVILGFGSQSYAQCNAPKINSFTPNTGFIGSTVTIFGANFDVNPSNNQVFFGATEATVTSASFGKLEVIVPVGATLAPISVKNNCNKTAYSKVPFNGIFCPTPITASTYNSTDFEMSARGAYNMIAMDLDLDGKPEVISGNHGGGMTIAYNRSTPGNLNFSRFDISTYAVQGHASADFDGDGKMDIVISGNDLRVVRNISTPGNLRFESVRRIYGGVGGYQIAIGDFNNDGKIDFVTGSSNGRLYFFRNTSTGPGNISFQYVRNVYVGTRCTGLQVADVDGDGKVDVLGTQGNYNRAISLRNITTEGSSSFGFEGMEVWSTNGYYPYRCMIADFDKDGKIDLTTCNYNGATNTAIFRNISTPGDISFARSINLPSPRNNYRIGVGDANGDGYPDIITKSLGVNVFSIYENTGTTQGALSFAPRIDYTSSSRAEVSGIVIADLDGDFVPDIATSGISSNTIRFHRNNSSQDDNTAPTAVCKNITVALSPEGRASITAADVDNGSSDACGLDNISVSRTEFTCNDIGENEVTLTVTDNAGNVSTCTAIVTVSPAAVYVYGQTTVCQGETIELSTNDGESYQWLKDGSIIQGATSQSYTATVTGDYSVTVTNSLGCSGTSNPLTLTVNENPTVDVTGNQFLCGNPGSTTLNASQSAIYQWKLDGNNIAGATQQSLVVSTTGNYSVEVIDLFGCSAVSDAIVVSNPAAPSIITKNISVDLNDKGYASILAEDINNGSEASCGNLTLSLSQSSFDCSNVGENVVTLTGTDQNGSSASSTAIVTVTGLDSDGDNIPNVCDLDDDNDGIMDGAECTISNFFWSNAPQITGANTAAGTINGIGYTYTSSRPVYTTGNVFAHSVFPSSYGIPNQTAIRNIEVSRNTLTFDQPMTNPVLVFSSIGQGGIAVPIQFETPVQVLWSTATTINSPTRITGREGYAIVRLNGTFSSISFDYLAYENYVNFSFGADFFNTCDTDGDGIVDQLDLDSDNDGCPDAIEAGHQDLDNDGVLGNSPVTVDANGLVLSQGGYTGSNNVVVDANLNGCNEAPVAVCKNITLNADANCSAVITASDVDGGSSDPDGDELTFSIDNAGPFTVGTHTVNLTVTDPAGESDACTATVTVEDNEAPVALAQDLTVQLDANGNASITANEVNNGSNDACGIASLSVAPNAFNCANVGNNTVTLTVTDVNGNVSTVDANVTVEDNEAPVALAQDLTVQLDANGNASITANEVNNGSNDACGVASLSVAPNVFNCANVGNNTVTLTVTDVNGNVSTVDAKVSVEDNVAPVAVAQNVTIQLDENGNALVTAGQVNNGSSDACGIASIALDKVSFDCSNLGDNTVELTVVDVNGNSSATNATVTVVDEIVPTITCPSDIHVVADRGDCDPVITWSAPVANDNCSFSVVSNYESGEEFPVGSYEVVYTVTDIAENNAYCSFNVTVEAEPLVITNAVISEYVGGNNVSCFGSTDGSIVITVEGGCLPYTYEWNSANSSANASNLGAGTHTVTVTDANGTTTNATYVLTEPSLLETEISENQTVYFGYADSACADIAVSTIGGIAPYNVNWSTGSTATAINVCPETSTDYSATVTDANGCATHSVSKICVIDVIDHDHAEQSSKGKGKGPKTPKILICHKNGKTLSISINAVAAHLAHGDLLGDCDAERACHSTSGKRAVEHNHSNEVEIDNQTVIMEVYPNPTSSNATVSVSFEQEGEYTIAVFNMIGEKVQDLYSGNAIEGDIQDYKINASALKSGIYFINAYTSNGVIASQKLIVTK